VSITPEQPLPVSQAQQSQPQLLLSGFGGDDHVSPTQVLYEAAVENEDDDYWDVQSDEEMLDVEDQDNDDTRLASKEFNMIRRIHYEHANELAIRRHDAFIYDGLLTHYKPEYAASPLRNLKTARVFAHYIHVVSIPFGLHYGLVSRSACNVNTSIGCGSYLTSETKIARAVDGTFLL
jgi:hypothetical protein